jgi:hypothetical protein
VSGHEGGSGGSACVWAVVFWHAVTGVDGGDGLQWSELMVEAACDGWSRWWWQSSCMWVGAPPMSVLS